MQIQLEGAYNFRDIGGYINKEGRKVKEGLLYRSDELSKLTEKDIKILASLPLNTIIDYRNERERLNNEDKIIPGAKIYYLDPKADVAAMASGEVKDLRSYHHEDISSKDAYALMASQNKQFVLNDYSKNSYRKMLKLLLDINNCPLDQHCRGGKDRTGYGVALILLLLKVDEDVVIDDYLLTNVYKKEKNERSLKEVYDKTKNKDLVLALRYLKEAKKEFLLEALNLINNSFGGIENYVINELGITKKEIEVLRNNYLE